MTKRSQSRKKLSPPETTSLGRDPAQANDPPSALPYRPDIDGLRAIAVMLVVLFHAFPKLVPGGYVGVDVFFVISGYLITGLVSKGIAEGTFSFTGFYARRCVRLLPALLLVLPAVLLAGALRMLPDELVNLGEHFVAAAGFFSNFQIFRETGYFAAVADEKPLLHLWSLAIEEQFYLLWPLVLASAVPGRLSRVLMASILCLASLSFCIWVVDFRGQHTFGFFMLPTRLWELAAGGILALNEPRVRSFLSAHQRLRPHASLAWLGLALLFVIAFAFDKTTPFPGWHAMVPVLGALLVIAGGMADSGNRFLSAKAVVFIGLISYPLYLWHWPILAYLRISVTEPGTQAKLAAIGIAFLLAWATWSLVEQPVRKAVRPWSIRPVKIVAAGIFMLLAAAAAGVMTQQGWIQQPPRNASLGHEFYNLRTKLEYPGMEKDAGNAAVKGDANALANFVNAYRNYDSQAIYRIDKCSVTPERPVPAEECLSRQAPNQSAIFLWGDSHAEHLYPGLRAFLAKDVSILQLTSPGCPPLPAVMLKNAPACLAANELAMKSIVASRPDVVVIAAIWEDYLGIAQFKERLLSNIRKVSAAGVRNVVVVGDVPSWYPTLYQILARAGKIGENRPNYLFHPYLARMKAVDVRMREVQAKSQSFVYVSLLDKLCAKDDCLIRVGPNDMEDLIVFDYGHLTRSGSEYVVRNFLGREIGKFLAERR